MQELPRLLITLGDVAGIGPEVLLKLWVQPELFTQSQPVVVGDVAWLRQIAPRFGFQGKILEISSLKPWPVANINELPCIQGTTANLGKVQWGQPQAAAGQAAYDFLKWAIDHTKAREADAIVTLPLHKEGLHLAGLHYPGHTEILAQECGVQKFAMMLYAPLSNEDTSHRGGVGVAHVTLHQSMRSIFEGITTQGVLDKIELTHDIMGRLLNKKPRIGVCALNPHAGDGGIFGDEEANLIQPAVTQAARSGISVSGPWPSDTLFRRAKGGEFDGIVAMYHDQGHIALKLMSGFHLVNITLGLPIIRTSVAHGTAYDIVEKDCSDPFSLLAAVDVACKLVQYQQRTSTC
ncbi:MAG TPA: 4-hydroxythreonine-4-phosphate dehydrogenase PdxA [Gemmatales bacterium]|nr:4-hydroxythreonine-4-phosphate dehydrogenase PdxA [Gemmatales bacterium]